MKRFLLMTAALLCFVGLSGQSRIKDIPFRADHKKGLYIGVAPVANILTGQQEALAMALTDFLYNMQQNIHVNSVVTSTGTTSTTESAPSDSFSAVSENYCDIRIVDRATIDETEFILFKIVSGGDYNVKVNSRMASMSDGNMFTETLDLSISLTFKNQSGQEVLKWDWTDSSFRGNDRERRNIYSSVLHQN